MARAPEGLRLYAIGDIHGRLDLLQGLHELIRDDAERAGATHRRVVYLGDYIDRGLESRQVVDFLLDAPLEGFESVYLKGNHEQALLQFLDDPMVGPNWFFFGGDATLYSYRVAGAAPGIDTGRLAKIQEAFRETLPARHLDFYRALTLQHRAGDYLFVHAGIRPGVPAERQVESDLLWIRDEFLDSTADHGAVVVHGHTIMPEPVVRPNRVGIDTGAYASGHLTCLVLDGEERRFLQT
ncbi:MAG TPA: metallophosphoesterase family protein [Alphaproteobacteria bacterium]